MHNDSEGNPGIWKVENDTWGHIKHGLGEIRDPGAGSWMDRANTDLQRMFELRYVPSGDLTRMYGIDAPGGPIQRPGQVPRPYLPLPIPPRRVMV